jgi:hypothetical protein
LGHKFGFHCNVEFGYGWEKLSKLWHNVSRKQNSVPAMEIIKINKLVIQLKVSDARVRKPLL